MANPTADQEEAKNQRGWTLRRKIWAKRAIVIPGLLLSFWTMATLNFVMGLSLWLIIYAAASQPVALHRCPGCSRRVPFSERAYLSFTIGNPQAFGPKPPKYVACRYCGYHIY